MRTILAKDPAEESGHHLVTPYLAAHQLAIAFNEQYPDDVAGLALHVGDKGFGMHNSLAQHLARELSQPFYLFRWAQRNCRGITAREVRPTGESSRQHWQRWCR